VEQAPTVDLFGTLLASERDAAELLDGLVARAGVEPESDFRRHMSAFAHRAELFSLKHAVTIDANAATAVKEAAHGWVNRSWSTVRPWGSGGVFPNFPDPDLPDSGPAYYGMNYERLLRVKRRHDPDNVFRFHQSLPTGSR
jgi:hypothetical protein